MTPPRRQPPQGRFARRGSVRLRVALLLAAAAVLSGAAPAAPAGPSLFSAEERNVREGNERLLAGDPGSALLRYEAAERAVGSRPELDFDRGNALSRAGRPEEARAAWARAAARAPAPLASRAQQNTGTALASAGDGEGAVAALSEALRLDPTNEDARVNLEILLRRREAERARAERPRPAPGRQGDAGAVPQARGGDEQRPGQKGSDPPPAPVPQSGEARDAPAGATPREEAERLLDALRARERPMPLPGGDPHQKGGADADRDW
jgi:tetratricopeptide (TPR) repeat protein